MTHEMRQHWNASRPVDDRRSPLWAERANLASAMVWAVEHGDSDRALRLVGASLLLQGLVAVGERQA